MTKNCKVCKLQLKMVTKHGIGYTTYKCERCNLLYYWGDKKSKMIYKDGIKYINLNT